jgi:uncharacterized caspase-like protein
MRRARAFALAILATLLGAVPGHADKRVALVIGNSSYDSVPKLPNPTNDADAVGLLLRSAGFDVVVSRQNLGNVDFRRAIRDFTDKTQDADIAVVYFAGHGIEVDGANYLIPVDAKLDRDIDVDDETITLDRVLKVIEPAKRLRLVILDACRDNPFTRTMRRTFASRSVGRGLGRIEPGMSDTLIAYAAKAGSTATDGDGTHSPFTAALLRHLVTPGLDVRLAFGQVRDDVMKATGNRQEPFVYGSLGGGVVTLASLGTVEPVGVPLADPNAMAARDYEAAAKVGTKQAWDAFLQTHPKGVLCRSCARAARKAPGVADSRRAGSVRQGQAFQDCDSSGHPGQAEECKSEPTRALPCRGSAEARQVHARGSEHDLHGRRLMPQVEVGRDRDVRIGAVWQSLISIAESYRSGLTTMLVNPPGRALIASSASFTPARG